MKLSSLKINPTLIESGEWVGDLPEFGNLRILTKGLNNAAFRKMQAAQIRAIPRQDRKKGVDPDIQRKIQVSCVIETCTLGWENLEDADGTAIPYSKEKAKEIAADPQYEPFIDACILVASWVGDDKADEATDAAKN